MEFDGRMCYNNEKRKEGWKRMSTLDNLFHRARDVANDVGRRAGDVVEVSKLKLQVLSLTGDIDKVYEKLGLMVYEMAKAGAENQSLIDGCVAEVDALKAQLNEVNASLDALRNVRRCDSCGNAVELSAQFCPMCGSLLRRNQEASDTEQTVEQTEEKTEPVSAEPAAAECEAEEAAAESVPEEGAPEESAPEEI